MMRRNNRRAWQHTSKSGLITIVTSGSLYFIFGSRIFDGFLPSYVSALRVQSTDIHMGLAHMLPLGPLMRSMNATWRVFRLVLVNKIIVLFLPMRVFLHKTSLYFLLHRSFSNLLFFPVQRQRLVRGPRRSPWIQWRISCRGRYN